MRKASLKKSWSSFGNNTTPGKTSTSAIMSRMTNGTGGEVG